MYVQSSRITERDLQPCLVHSRRKLSAKPWPPGRNPRVRNGRHLRLVGADDRMGVDCPFCDWVGPGAPTVEDALWTYTLHCMLERHP